MAYIFIWNTEVRVDDVYAQKYQNIFYTADICPIWPIFVRLRELFFFKAIFGHPRSQFDS